MTTAPGPPSDEPTGRIPPQVHGGVSLPPQYHPPASGAPASGAPASGVPASGVPASGVPAPPRRPGRWTFVLALVAVVCSLGLGAVAVVQAGEIGDLRKDLNAARREASQAQASEDQRLDSLEGQVSQLGERAGQVFDPQAVAAAVLPSVFRVSAGRLAGSAFAVGSPDAGGNTRLLTAYHVVQQVWAAGQTAVQLERDGNTYPATITDIDQANDIALLTSPFKLAGLSTATGAVQAGQQIVVIGAPLGLTDSVTVGVVSAVREDEAGSGQRIQFDASINPGNSGGPVVNTSKQVVGIATAKAKGAEGIGLATPIQTACSKFRLC